MTTTTQGLIPEQDKSEILRARMLVDGQAADAQDSLWVSIGRRGFADAAPSP